MPRIAATLLFGLAFALTACSPPRSKEAIVRTYSLAGPIIHIMIIDKSKLISADDLPRLTKDFCSNREVKGCFVWAYFDQTLAPLEGLGGETGKGDPVFTYTSNWGTGFEQELWDCRIYPHVSDSDCLAVTREIH